MNFRTFRYALEFAPIWVADKILSLLPRRLCLAFGEMLGRIFGSFMTGRRELMRANLAHVFPDKTFEEREQIRKSVWANIGRVAAEFIRLSEITRSNFREYLIIEGEGLVEKAKAKGKGIIFVGFHFTNWEMTGLAGNFIHGHMTAVARPIKNPFVERWIQRKRGLGGMDIILHRAAVKGSLKALKEKKGIGILIDQNLYTGGLFADFLGRPAATTPLPALLHNRTGAPVLLLYCLRQGDKIRIIFEKAPDVSVKGEDENSLVPLTEAINRRLGELVRANPENWFWVHNRWKRKQVNESQS